MDVLISILLLLGMVLSVVAAIGIHRLRDAYSRLHATSALSTLGLISIIFASVFYFAGTSTAHSSKQLLAIVFIFITVPAGSHILSRSAIVRDVRLWKIDGKLSDEEKEIVNTLKEAAAAVDDEDLPSKPGRQR